jgi:hypothetical protein
MIQTTTATTEIIITEEYAVELTQTSRGVMAEVKDDGSPFNGTYALGSTRGCALAVLRAKVQEKKSR